VAAVAVGGGLKAVEIAQEVDENDEGVWKERGASEDAGDVGAALDPL
jgi:hypothetical protein